MINIAKEFQKIFDNTPIIARSSGRINLIGEHTDYNLGYVLPSAIDKSAYVAVSKNDTNEVRIFSYNFQEKICIDLNNVHITEKSWANYVLGIIDQLQQNNIQIAGINIFLYGEVPFGSGLSSSAALLCATVFSINELYGLGLSKLSMVKMAQMAEHTYAGVKCGIMDMFASMFSQKGSVIKLDCQTISHEYVPLSLDDYKIVLLNTNVSHSLASSEYNNRRQECEQGLAWISAFEPDVKSLRDVTLAHLNQYVLPKDNIVYIRCKYVIEENQRLLEACEKLQRNDFTTLGKNMFASHEGLKNKYQVSCHELDFLVDAVKDNPNVLGARMMGGGFGGCTINIVKEEGVEVLIESLSPKYKAYSGLDLSPHIVKLETGTELLAI